MLGTDRFAFETPNAVDPGDMPPGRPAREQGNNGTNIVHEQHEDENARKNSGHSITNSTTEDTVSADSAEEYHQARESAARLLRDIGDLDITPSKSVPIYDPYDEEEEEEEQGEDYEPNNHSLPPYATGRFATSLMKTETQPLSFTRTVKLGEGRQSRHLVQKRVLHVLKPVCLVFVVMALILGASVGILNRSKNNDVADSSPLRGNNADKILFDDEATVRFQTLVRVLAANGVSSSESMTTKGTPQYKAAHWFANVDNEQRTIPADLALSNDEERVIQRYVLAVFYFATGGEESWTETLDFLTAADECSWQMEKAMPQWISEEYTFGVGCDENLVVRSLFLSSNNLTGELPNEIRFLSSISLFSLPSNKLSGEIPQALKDMQGIIYLNLNFNNFSGSIPDFIGDFKGLEVLGLSGNELMGDVPASLSTLGFLKTLALDDNALTGDISFAKYLRAMKHLYLDQNMLTGVIGSDFVSSLPELRELDISDNELEGQIDLTWFFQTENLHVVDLANNKFTGQIPESIEKNVVLHYLSLRGNSFDGSIPSSITSLQVLRHLDLHENQFSGDIQNSIGSMSSLTFLALGMNNFGQDLPPLNQLTNLRELSLEGLSLTEIPSWIKYTSNLEYLDMSHNDITGQIPTELWGLPNIQYIILNDNQLTGNIPTNGGQHLKFLSLHRNSLSGDANHVCDSAPDLKAIATDCSVACSSSCCRSCCTPGDENCFEKEESDFMNGMQETWEVNYIRDPFSFDPSLLAEAGLFEILDV